MGSVRGRMSWDTMFDLRIPSDYQQDHCNSEEKLPDKEEIVERSILEELSNALQQLGVIVWVIMLVIFVDLTLEFVEKTIRRYWKKEDVSHRFLPHSMTENEKEKKVN